MRTPSAGPGRPEPLSLRFANTRYAERGHARDAIGTPELLRDWLTRHAAELGRPGRAGVAAFAELRDAVRALIAVAAHEPGASADPDHCALLNRLSAGAASWPTLVRAGGRFRAVERSTADHGTPALAALARDAILLLGGDLADDLRACHAPGCVQFFLKDHPRREWCSPACGNRARAARHYQRHHSAPSSELRTS
ncbi:CGNR zinc finger domain-containing protein [Actinoplanes sp. CA-030573]|uniref:CGNR zinc finger domain-containing protein n=1 Tax=Actinoplanes sp. CA-030573 TaxID=3239898 RepID=UPI003D8F73F2